MIRSEWLKFSDVEIFPQEFYLEWNFDDGPIISDDENESMLGQ